MAIKLDRLEEYVRTISSPHIVDKFFKHGLIINLDD